MREQILDGEPPALGLPQQVDRLQVEGPPHGVDLRHTPLQPPEGPVVGLVRFTTAELIIEDDRAVRRQRCERRQVVMPGARSAVQGSSGMPPRPTRRYQTR
jgi:hypothetical protein